MCKRCDDYDILANRKNHKQRATTECEGTLWQTNYRFTVSTIGKGVWSVFSDFIEPLKLQKEGFQA